MSSRHWTLGAKLGLVGTPFFVLALASLAALVWMSQQLEGGAAAVNEAGRLRMQVYRLVFAAGAGDAAGAERHRAELESSLRRVAAGDRERPLFVPWNPLVRDRFAEVEAEWQRSRAVLVDAAPSARAPPGATAAAAAALSARIDAFVSAVEARLVHWTSLLYVLQLAMLAAVILGAAAIVYAGHVLVIEPVGALEQATRRIREGDLGARVGSAASGEFDALATRFNGMAEQLQSIYRQLEERVREKTAELQDKRERLEALYGVTRRLADATTVDEAAKGFCAAVVRIARADAVALRWADETRRRYVMLASEGLPESMLEAEHCIGADDCLCAVSVDEGRHVIPIRSVAQAPLGHCEKAGFATVVAVPIRLHERTLGEVDLFFHADVGQSDAERSLLEALAAQLAAALESLRLHALGREEAVSQERLFIARELHDSIAQSLAFLKMQVQLLRDALAAGDSRQAEHVLGEIDAGVRESYGDVRELLIHFRTRARAEDIEPALLATLRKFEHQTGLDATLHMSGAGLPLAPDTQIQVLHVLQEALSNVRKHARATRVRLDAEQGPRWRFEVRDDGVGFDAAGWRDETHVGLAIMRERAERLAATLDVVSAPGRGTSVVLTMPPLAGASAGARDVKAAP